MKPRISVPLVVMLAGCHPAPPSPQAPAALQTDARALYGHAALATWKVQALEGDLKPAGTVSVLDAGNNVVASGVTDSSGNFNLNPFVNWTPAINTVYVLDLTKRFEGSNDNAMLRLRTLVAWTGSQWSSISGSTANASGGSGVLINSGTTAVADIQGLRGLAALNCLGTLDPASSTFSPGTSGIQPSDFTTVKALVASALAANLDPVRALTWSPVDNAYFARLVGRNGHLRFDLANAPSSPGTNPLPVRTRYGLGYACAPGAALYLGQFGSYGNALGDVKNPMDVAFDANGNLYANDFGNNRVEKFDSQGNFLSAFGGPGGGSGQFSSPTDVQVDPQGNLWVDDYSNHRIQKLDPNGSFLMGIGQGTVWTSGPAPAPSSGTADGWFNAPHYVRLDRAGNVWVADTFNQRIQEFSPSGAFLRGIGNGTTWTGPAPAPTSGNGAGYFYEPTGIDFDAQGSLWVCDRRNNRLQKFDASGTNQGVYGSYGAGNGQFNWPEALGFDADGNLWVSELYGNRVQKFDPSFNYLGQFGAPGSAPGQFIYPRGLGFDPLGDLLVADWNNHRLQRFAPATTVLSYSPAYVPTAQGTLEERVTPSWAGTTAGRFNLFEFTNIGSGQPTSAISVYKAGSVIELDYWQNGSVQSLTTDISSWLPGSDHHVAVTWSSTNVSLYLDGGFAVSLAPAGPLASAMATFTLGNNYQFSFPANALLDSCRVFDYPKSLAEIQQDGARIDQY